MCLQAYYTEQDSLAMGSSYGYPGGGTSKYYSGPQGPQYPAPHVRTPLSHPYSANRRFMPYSYLGVQFPVLMYCRGVHAQLHPWPLLSSRSSWLQQIQDPAAAQRGTLRLQAVLWHRRPALTR